MEKKVIDAINYIVPSKKLKEALAFLDYEDAACIIQELLDNFVAFDRFTLFDMLLEAIKENDSKKVVEVILLSESAFKLSLAYEIVSFNDNLAKGFNMDYEETEIYNEDISLIVRVFELENIDYYIFAKKLLSLKDDRFELAEAIEKVFDMRVIGTDVDKVLSAHLEALIDGNEITCVDIMHAVLDNDAKTLMEKVMAIKALREFFYDYKSIETYFLKEKIDNMLSIGLKRDKAKTIQEK